MNDNSIVDLLGCLFSAIMFIILLCGCIVLVLLII